MNGYFSRLIRQTGITIQPRQGPETGTGMIGAGFGKYEFGAEVRPRRTDMTENLSGNLGKTDSPTAAAERIAWPVPEAGIQEKQMTKKSLVLEAIGEHKKTATGENIRGQSSLKPGETNRSHVIEKNQGKEFRIGSKKRTFTDKQTRKDGITEKNTTRENGRIEPDNSFSLKHIRDWVAAAPEPEDVKSDNGMESMNVKKKAREKLRIKESWGGERSMQDIDRPEGQMEVQLDWEPEGQLRDRSFGMLTTGGIRDFPSENEKAPDEGRDFNLTIGTISITVEDYQKQHSPAELPRIVEMESTSGNNRESQRLGRHFIRLK